MHCAIAATIGRYLLKSDSQHWMITDYPRIACYQYWIPINLSSDRQSYFELGDINTLLVKRGRYFALLSAFHCEGYRRMVAKLVATIMRVWLKALFGYSSPTSSLLALLVFTLGELNRERFSFSLSIASPVYRFAAITASKPDAPDYT